MLENWLQDFTKKINESFPKRIIFIGIQGSYARGEATENSDIDVVVIFDKLIYSDIKRYDEIISKMPMREKICGFISGKKELENWDRSDLFQFYHDTIALYGSLNFIKNLITNKDISRAVRLGACNIYHMCVHNAIHEKSDDILKSLLKCEEYINKRKILLENINSQDKEILLLNPTDDLDFVSQKLIAWSANLIAKD